MNTTFRSMMIAALMVSGLAAPAAMADERTSADPLTVFSGVGGAMPTKPTSPTLGSFSVSLDGLPDQVEAGGVLTGSFSISHKGDPAGERLTATIAISIVTPLGEAPVRQSTIRIVSGRTKTIRFGLPVDERAQPGIYTIIVSTTIDGETLRVGHQVEVIGKR